MKLLTVAVPSFNSQDYLENCIESLLTGVERMEIIIINDGSTDNTVPLPTLTQPSTQASSASSIRKTADTERGSIKVCAALPVYISRSWTAMTA